MCVAHAFALANRLVFTDDSPTPFPFGTLDQRTFPTRNSSNYAYGDLT
jgi:hypothetical protein